MYIYTCEVTGFSWVAQARVSALVLQNKRNDKDETQTRDMKKGNPNWMMDIWTVPPRPLPTPSNTRKTGFLGSDGTEYQVVRGFPT